MANTSTIASSPAIGRRVTPTVIATTSFLSFAVVRWWKCCRGFLSCCFLGFLRVRSDAAITIAKIDVHIWRFHIEEE